MSDLSHDNEGASRKRLAAFLAAAAAYITIACVLLLVPRGAFFGHALAVAAGSILFAELLALLRWCGKGYLGENGPKRMLLGVFATRVVLCVAVIACGYALAPGAWSTVVVTFGFAGLGVSHLRTPRRVADWLKRHGAPKPKERKRRIDADLESGVVTLKVTHNAAETVSELLELFGRWRRIPRLLPGMVALMLILCSAALAVGILTKKWVGEPSHSKPTTSALTPTPTTPAPTPSAPTPTTPAPPPEPKPERTCHAVAQLSHPDGKAVAAVARLYDYESKLPPRREGCYGQIIREAFPLGHPGRERYFTTIGTGLAGEELSYALDSERFGTVLFLWSVASLIKAIIAKVGPVGGVGRFPYYEAGTGELYLLRCRVGNRVGNIVLIHRSKAEEWVELPPSAARAWLGRMNALGKWLWPSQPHSLSDGETDFDLSTSEGEGAGTIRVVPSGSAQLDGVPYPVEPAYELSLSELVKRSADA